MDTTLERCSPWIRGFTAFTTGSTHLQSTVALLNAASRLTDWRQQIVYIFPRTYISSFILRRCQNYLWHESLIILTPTEIQQTVTGMSQRYCRVHPQGCRFTQMTSRDLRRQPLWESSFRYTTPSLRLFCPKTGGPSKVPRSWQLRTGSLPSSGGLMDRRCGPECRFQRGFEDSFDHLPHKPSPVHMPVSILRFS